MNMPTSAHCGRAQLAVQAEEQADRRAEELQVAGELAEARRPVLARDVDRGVEVLAALEAPGAERVPQALRIDRVFRLLHRRGRDQRLERRQRPRRPGRRPARAGGCRPDGRPVRRLQDLPHHRAIDRIGPEGPHRHRAGSRLRLTSMAGPCSRLTGRRLARKSDPGSSKGEARRRWRGAREQGGKRGGLFRRLLGAVLALLILGPPLAVLVYRFVPAADHHPDDRAPGPGPRDRPPLAARSRRSPRP